MTGTGGQWISWDIDGRAGAKLQLGAVFLGEISHPHDFGLGPRWKAWLNHNHLGFFATEAEARQKIEAEILKRMQLMRPEWESFQERVSPQVARFALPARAAERMTLVGVDRTAVA